MSAEKVTIGRIARAAGVHIETVRYYQRRGLVGVPPKRTQGFRYYAPETATRVRFIKRAQALGMSLKDVRIVKHEALNLAVNMRTADALFKDGPFSYKLLQLAADQRYGIEAF